MLLKIKHVAVKVRHKNSHKLVGADRFTGASTYSVVGNLDDARVRLALGTEHEVTAIRRIEKIKTACAVGPNSPIWSELEETLPPATFKFFADRAGYIKPTLHSGGIGKATWADLCAVFRSGNAEAHREQGPWS